jgi:aspartate/methionine/tyrosine aminotransferase
MAMARYLERAIADGSLRDYIDRTNALYAEAARVTLAAIDTHIGRRRLVPVGGLYTVLDVGRDADSFVPEALKATGVLVVPGGGFGPSIRNGVRISFGPMVTTPERIVEGIERLGRWMRG